LNHVHLVTRINFIACKLSLHSSCVHPRLPSYHGYHGVTVLGLLSLPTS